MRPAWHIATTSGGRAPDGSRRRGLGPRLGRRSPTGGQLVDGVSGRDQRQMREALREIPDLPLAPGIVLLREQPERIPQREQALEQLLGLGLPPGERVIVSQPEAAGEERALVARQA